MDKKNTKTEITIFCEKRQIDCQTMASHKIPKENWRLGSNTKKGQK